MHVCGKFDLPHSGECAKAIKKGHECKKLIAAAREIYRETVTSVRVGGIESEIFWTTKGLRQGCLLSTNLFACYISDIEEMFRGVQARGIVVGREKVWCLAFADDLVIKICKDTLKERNWR
ncbi:hypothetical protein Zmor_028147 [Zophobas morio]|uniref:Reverse transcriptase domain-containing protein n=1 Tax=Zophobas morio TaxID=2755281 RepID=A0AA38HQ99_9CUCU|nr:hypothetical protein Zmor_028147 [Zophobas morio]